MTKLELILNGETKEYDIPTSWDDVTVDKYTKIMNIDPNLKGVLLSIKLAEVILDIPENDINELPIEDFNIILDKMKFLNKEVKPKKGIESVTINNETFFIKRDYNKLKTGEVASIDMILSDVDGNWYQVIDKLLCIYLRKQDKSGELEGFKPEFMLRSEKFKNLKITEVIDIFFSFSNGEKI